MLFAVKFKSDLLRWRVSIIERVFTIHCEVHNQLKVNFLFGFQSVSIMYIVQLLRL